jgi:hypothetical protein
LIFFVAGINLMQLLNDVGAAIDESGKEIRKTIKNIHQYKILG